MATGKVVVSLRFLIMKKAPLFAYGPQLYLLIAEDTEVLVGIKDSTQQPFDAVAACQRVFD